VGQEVGSAKMHMDVRPKYMQDVIWQNKDQVVNTFKMEAKYTFVGVRRDWERVLRMFVRNFIWSEQERARKRLSGCRCRRRIVMSATPLANLPETRKGRA
jgi:hypothetical protein